MLAEVDSGKRSRAELLAEIESLQRRLADSEELQRAIQHSEVDAFVVNTAQGERVFTMEGAEHPYRVLVESMNEGAATLSPDGSVLYGNSRLAAMLDLPLEKLIGSSLPSHVAGPDKRAFRALLERGAEEQCKGEIELLTAGGQRLPVLVSCARIGPGTSSGLCVVVTDLSERRGAEKISAAEKLARSIIDQAGEAIVVCDENGQITHINQQAMLLCGPHPEWASFDAVFPLQIADPDLPASSSRSAIAGHFSIGGVLQGAAYRNVDVLLHLPSERVAYLVLNATPLRNAQRAIFGCVVTLTDITVRKQMEAALQESEERLKLFIAYAPASLAMFDRDMRYLYASRRWRADYQLGDRDLAGVSHYEVFPEISEAWKDAHRRGLAGEVLYSAGDRFERQDGTVQWVRWELRPWYDAQHCVGGIVIFTEDVTQRKQMEDDLREQEEFFRLIAENLEGFVAVLDAAGHRVYNSPSYARLLGERDLTGTSSFLEIHPEDRERVMQAFHETVETGIGQRLEYRFMMANGRICRLESRSGAIMDARGRTRRVVVVSHDITDRKRAEEEIHHLAFYDALTQLPNRLTLKDRLNQAMAASKRSGCYGALMFIDLDNFKPANDLYGHEVGDLLLIEVASRLKSCMRAEDTVARFGGDEFVVMLRELETDQAASMLQTRIVAEKIRIALAEPYQLCLEHEAGMTIEHHCTASIGVVLFIAHQASRDDILKWADSAMYQAKEAGRNMIRFWGV